MRGNLGFLSWLFFLQVGIFFKDFSKPRNAAEMNDWRTAWLSQAYLPRE